MFKMIAMAIFPNFLIFVRSADYCAAFAVFVVV